MATGRGSVVEDNAELRRIQSAEAPGRGPAASAGCSSGCAGTPHWSTARPGPHNGRVSLDPDAGSYPALTARTSALLDAVVAIGSDLDLHAVLDRIVRSACTLTGARTARSVCSRPAAAW